MVCVCGFIVFGGAGKAGGSCSFHGVLYKKVVRGIEAEELSRLRARATHVEVIESKVTNAFYISTMYS